MSRIAFFAVALGVLGCEAETCYKMEQDGKDVGRMFVVTKSSAVQYVRWMLTTSGDRFDFVKGVTFKKQPDATTCGPLKWGDKKPGDDPKVTCYDNTNKVPKACLKATSAEVPCFVEGVPMPGENLAACNGWPASLPKPLAGPGNACPTGTTVGVLSDFPLPPADAHDQQGDKGFRCSVQAGLCADGFWAAMPASQSDLYFREYTCERFWGKSPPIGASSAAFGPVAAFSGVHKPESGEMSATAALGTGYDDANSLDLRLTYLSPCACQTLGPPPPSAPP